MYIATCDDVLVIGVADKLVIGMKDALRKLPRSDSVNSGASSDLPKSFIVHSREESEAATPEVDEDSSIETPADLSGNGQTKPKTSKPHNVGLVSNRPDIENSKWYSAVAVSSKGNYVAASDNLKTLLVYKVKDERGILLDKPVLASSQKLTKRTMALTFTADEKMIIVADKLGDAYAFGREEKTRDPPLSPILGHLSVITDVKLSRDEKYILTGDRDEKIRVSHYPLADDIQSFCLGHTRYVTRLTVPDVDYPLVISGAGDGTIRAFNYVTGLEYGSHSFVEVASDHPPHVVAMACRFPVLLVALNQQNQVLGFRIPASVEGDASDPGGSFPFTPLFHLQLSSSILAMAFVSESLVVLQNDPTHPIVCIPDFDAVIEATGDGNKSLTPEEVTTELEQTLLSVLQEVKATPGHLENVFRDPFADIFSPTYERNGGETEDSTNGLVNPRSKKKKRSADSMSGVAQQV